MLVFFSYSNNFTIDSSTGSLTLNNVSSAAAGEYRCAREEAQGVFTYSGRATLTYLGPGTYIS